jgi:hypothetical protein
MKRLFALFIAAMFFVPAIAQKIDYKNNVISVDGKDLVKVNRIKKNFGLTSDFEVYSLSGKKLIIAVIAPDFIPPNNDNSFYYYRFTFLTADQVGVFKVNKLWAEKSFVKLIGSANIFANDDVDPGLLKDFIARASENPPIALDYTRVSRNFAAPVVLNEDKTISQQNVIGRFTDVTNDPNVDTYEISLPNSVLVAKIKFTGRNNAQNFDVYTPKDNAHRIIPLHTADHVIASSNTADRNDVALLRIVKWLVSQGYL